MIGRDKKINQNLYMIMVWLILGTITLLIFLCLSGYLCHKKYKRKHNFFGHNNAEDDLVIEHHYSQPV